MAVCKDLSGNEDNETIHGSDCMTPQLPNVVAPVRQRLLNMIRETGDDANLIWTRYATERLLYRLSVSEYAGSRP